MSTDGTRPPSITPKNPAPAGTGTTIRPAGGYTRPPGASRPGDTATQSRPVPPPPSSATGPSPSSPPPSPSVTERLKQVAHSAAESARSVLPSRDVDEDERERQPDDGAPGHHRPGPTTATAPSPAPAPAQGPRKVRLAVARIDPWSIMKLAFLLSVAIGIMMVVAAAVIWFTLDELAVFTSVNETIAEVTGSPTFFPLLEFVAFDRVISLATIIAIVDIVLITALSTIGAFLYNIVAALVGGINLTLTDD